MGWGSGSEVAQTLIRDLPKVVPDEGQRLEVYKVLIRALEDQDWDTQSDCLDRDPVFDQALKELHPKWDL